MISSKLSWTRPGLTRGHPTSGMGYHDHSAASPVHWDPTVAKDSCHGPMPNPAPIAALLLAWIALATPGPLHGAQTENDPPAADLAPAINTVVLEAVRIEPRVVGPETLCHLWVTLHNRGEATASLLGFEVVVGGEPLPQYATDLFVTALAPGERQEVELFNFWSSETGRPLPDGDALDVTVRLLEATWYAIEEPIPGEPTPGDHGPLETWQPLGAVDALPSEARTAVAIARGPAESGGGESGGAEDDSVEDHR